MQNVMQNLTGDLLVFEAPSFVAGFRALATIQSETLQLIDASPSGAGQFLILVKGEGSELASLLKAMREAHAEPGHDEVIDHELIEGANEKILEAAYSLVPAKIQGALLVIETETVSAMFAAAQIFVSIQNLSVLEIRIRRSGIKGAYAYFTGTAADCALAAEDVRTRFKHSVRAVKIETFDKPNAAILSLFEGA